MCIAILKPENIIVPEAHLKESFDSNPDGAGFMYAENNELHIEKGFMTYASFMEAYKQHETKPMAIHFRIATHGETNPENTHPFRVGKNLGFIHNGIISKVSRKDDEAMSDTYHFNTKILANLYKRDSRFIFKDWYAELVKEYIGYSKLVFLNNKGHHTIVNEQMGHWDEGVWYSNKSYEPRKIIAPYTPKKDVDVLAIGTKVKVKTSEYEDVGTIEYFGQGFMVGVKLEGKGHIRLIPQMCLTELHEHKFEVGDWVVRTDGIMPDGVGEVTGSVGEMVLVKWLGSNGMFEGKSYGISEHKLDYWWNVDEETRSV